MVDRTIREDWERLTLRPQATFAKGAGNRAISEEPDDVRTCFERDRDRIVHSTAFRRLAGKTQVHVYPTDHQRTRLTHALEVAQVATSIARTAGLNATLADVVLAGLNLCAETLDGIRNHSWSRPAPGTPEGEVVSWADRIAYCAHDLEDAVHTGIVADSDLPAEVADVCGRSRRAQLNTFVRAVSRCILEQGEIAMPAAEAAALASLREFNYERIYVRPASLSQSRAVIEVLQALVEYYVERPELIPGSASPTGEGRIRAAVGYVAGMTDRYAFEQAVAELGWDRTRLPQGVDRHV
jgi:dGTPase